MTQRLNLPGFSKLLSITALLTLLTGFAVAQRTVSGKVTDAETKAPLAGVSVVVNGTTKGTATDAEGLFKLDLTADQKALVFSFNGYEGRVVNVGNQTMLNVEMEVDVK
ncbi:MAG: hypothetical protein RL131_61, partial [Bacteroidota bacterium]